MSHTAQLQGQIDALKAQLAEVKQAVEAAVITANEAKQTVAAATQGGRVVNTLTATKPPPTFLTLTELKTELDRLEKAGKTTDPEYKLTLDQARLAADNFAEIRDLDLRRQENLPGDDLP